MLSFKNIEIVQQLNKYDWKIIREYCEKNDYRCLIVHHDKEGNDHFHAYIQFRSYMPLDNIVKQLKIEAQYIQHIKSWKNALTYAFYLGNTSKEEELDESCILFNNKIDLNEEVWKKDNKLKEKEVKKARKELVLKSIYSYGNLELSQKKLIDFLTSEEYYRYSTIIRKMEKFRTLKKGNGNMKILYITGNSGSGKTTLAKFFAKSYNYDYFVTWSDKYPLSGYDMEECIIIDDLKGDTFAKSKLFKLLNNNINSSVKSRYNNKDLSNCKLLIITSIKNPLELYDWSIESSTETFKQLGRRLNNEFMFIDSDGKIKGMVLDSENKTIDFKKTYFLSFDMNMVYSTLNISRLNNQTGFDDIVEHFKQYCQKIQNERFEKAMEERRKQFKGL